MSKCIKIQGVQKSCREVEKRKPCERTSQTHVLSHREFFSILDLALLKTIPTARLEHFWLPRRD